MVGKASTSYSCTSLTFPTTLTLAESLFLDNETLGVFESMDAPIIVSEISSKERMVADMIV